MSMIPGQHPPRSPDELIAESGSMGTFARIEGLIGEEDALLRIPAKRRTDAQHERLRAIADELDRIWEKLRDRAERAAQRHQPGASHP
jgi:hypothetical protein